MKHSHGRQPDLSRIADQAMIDNGLEPRFSTDALKQLETIQKPGPGGTAHRDLTGLLWCSIDNDDSRDLDQLSVAEEMEGGRTRIWVAVADVDSLVTLRSPLDIHARKNTTSVYTGVKLYPMLPEKLSTDLTSLNQDEERVSLVIEMVIEPSGKTGASEVYQALVKNKAKLTYHGVGDWLEAKGDIPPEAAKVPGMENQLRIQDQAAQKMRSLRHEQGALELETLQPRPVTKDGQVVGLAHEMKNRAGELIEDFMIAANGVTARYLTGKNFPTLRRVVRTPERWPRIVELAGNLGEKLPDEPDSKSLAEFLTRQKARDPLRFPDLSLTVIKLMGRGEYVMEEPGQAPLGHFGLAVRDYNHSTAPNRRYPDLVTLRLLKAAINARPSPYESGELSSLAVHCTQQENAADKVERSVRKSAGALLMTPRVGEYFEAIVTGASVKGTWVRLLHPPVEGYVAQGSRGLDVGDQVRVKLISVNVEKGWIDFAAIPR